MIKKLFCLCLFGLLPLLGAQNPGPSVTGAIAASGGGTITSINSASMPNNAQTSSPVNMTGANLCLITETAYASTPGTPSSSPSNTWNLLATQAVGDGAYTALYASTNPTVSASMTFTLGAGAAIAGIVKCYNTPAPTATPQITSNYSVSSPIQPGSITPTQNGSLFVCVFGDTGTASPYTVSSPFSFVSTITGISYVQYGVGFADLIQSSAAAENPQLTTPSTGGWGTIMAVWVP